MYPLYITLFCFPFFHWTFFFVYHISVWHLSNLYSPTKRITESSYSNPYPHWVSAKKYNTSLLYFVMKLEYVANNTLWQCNLTVTSCHSLPWCNYLLTQRYIIQKWHLTIQIARLSAFMCLSVCVKWSTLIGNYLREIQRRVDWMVSFLMVSIQSKGLSVLAVCICW